MLQEIILQEKFKSCIEACYLCATSCDHCATACLQEEHIKAMATCIHLNRFCVEACQTAASFMAKTSGVGHEGYVKQMCSLCAQICEDCANECEKHEVEHCKVCAEACRKCADECYKMAA